MHEFTRASHMYVRAMNGQVQRASGTRLTLHHGTIAPRTHRLLCESVGVETDTFGLVPSPQRVRGMFTPGR
jgi:hypothetical protein